MKKIVRVLVVDDSVVHRQTISELLRELDDVEVVGRAIDGQEALRMAALLEPDLITLDLEMPRMDGFTFLRLIMGSKPRPVFVISSYSNVENVFKALELGAMDFLPRAVSGDLAPMRAALHEKIKAIRDNKAHPRAMLMATLLKTSETGTFRAVQYPPPKSTNEAPRHVIVVGSSAGGPPAILDLVARLPPNFAPALVIAQHMPERFTKSFADRLARRSGLRVVEAEDNAYLTAGSVWICPGNRSTELVGDSAERIRFRVYPVEPSDRYSPSIDRLFASVSRLPIPSTAVVITGMGDDGVLGAKELMDKGNELWVEASETAIVDGMPAAARALDPDLVLPLPGLLARIAAFEIRSPSVKPGHS